MLNPNIDLDAQEQFALAAINPKAVLELVRRVRAAEAQNLPLRHELAKAKAILARKMRRESKHPDDAAVDRFAEIMKEKLAAARTKGRCGWEDPEQCSTEFLADLFVGHLGKDNPGNIEDLANILMMLHQRQAPLASIKDAMLRRKEQDLAVMQSDLDEADRRAGAAERAKAHLEEDAYRRKAWLAAAKREAGYPDNVSFDVVWKEILAKAKGMLQIDAPIAGGNSGGVVGNGRGEAVGLVSHSAGPFTQAVPIGRALAVAGL